MNYEMIQMMPEVPHVLILASEEELAESSENIYFTLHVFISQKQV